MFDSKSSRSEDFINHDEIIKVLEYGRIIRMIRRWLTIF